MNWGRLYLGLLVVTVGLLLLLDNTDILDFGSVVGDWWPLAVVGAGLVSFLANPRHWPVALILVLVGAALLLSTLDVVDVLAVVIPGVIILIGILLIAGRGLAPRSEVGDRINSFNVFSGSELASHSKQFQGGSVAAVFGGAEVDLRDAVPAPGASIDVFTAFGGVEIRVPQGWAVETHGLPLFAGIENATAKEQVPPEAPRLVVHATALFGGVEIKH